MISCRIGFTLRTYGHVMPGLHEIAAQRFEDALLEAVSAAPTSATREQNVSNSVEV
jgi:hypothetical protein